MRPSYVEGGTHDYVRHGTSTLFASLDVTTGEVISQCKPRHRQQGFLGFLRQIENSVPGDLDENLIINNYCSKNHAKVRAWLAQQPSFHVHYTPTSIRSQGQCRTCGRIASMLCGRGTSPICPPRWGCVAVSPSGDRHLEPLTWP